MPVKSLRDAIVGLVRRANPRRLGFAVAALIFIVSASVLGATLFSHEESSSQATSPFKLGTVQGAGSPGTESGAPPAAFEPPPLDPNDVPSRLVIDSIGVDAPVAVLGLDDEGVPQVPLNGTDVGWYHFSSLPVRGSNAVFSGHLEWSGGHAVFERLGDLTVGDRIMVEMGNGAVIRYDVIALFEIDPTDPSTLGLMGPTAGDVITLITCGGEWVPDPDKFFGGDYSERTVVRAIRLQQP
jgi:LPXTG-site transpeptidase (sortase) family protein